MRAHLLAPLSVTLMAATPASAYTAINGLTVNPVGQGAYEVVSYGGDGPRQIWCAAGQYARQMLGHGNNARVSILRGYGPSATIPGKRGVTFTTAPTNGPRPGSNGNYSVSIRTPGFNLSTAHAEGFCQDVFDIEDDWPL